MLSAFPSIQLAARQSTLVAFVVPASPKQLYRQDETDSCQAAPPDRMKQTLVEHPSEQQDETDSCQAAAKDRMKHALAQHPRRQYETDFCQATFTDEMEQTLAEQPGLTDKMKQTSKSALTHCQAFQKACVPGLSFMSAAWLLFVCQEGYRPWCRLPSLLCQLDSLDKYLATLHLHMGVILPRACSQAWPDP